MVEETNVDVTLFYKPSTPSETAIKTFFTLKRMSAVFLKHLFPLKLFSFLVVLGAFLKDLLLLLLLHNIYFGLNLQRNF